jgi:hypothetical protein
MRVSSAARTARWFHKIFPFAELRTAKWTLSRYRHAELPAAKLFGYDLALEPRTSVHVLLYLERERFVEDAIFLGPYIRECMTAFDIAANLGYLTLLLCRKVGPTGHVFAFEPEPENFGELVRNVENPEEACSFLQRYYRRIIVYRTWGEVRGQLPDLKKLCNTFVPANHIRKRCETTLDQVRAYPTGRFQLLCLPEERQEYFGQCHSPASEF